MVAIDVDSESHQPDGTIVSVYRSGYMHQGHILATAQVKVAKAK
jgi:molecular chaperone GrpE (heat shock protein)